MDLEMTIWVIGGDGLRLGSGAESWAESIDGLN